MSFNYAFLASFVISIALHGVAFVVLWTYPPQVSPARPRLFSHGEHAIEIVLVPSVPPLPHQELPQKAPPIEASASPVSLEPPLPERVVESPPAPPAAPALPAAPPPPVKQPAPAAPPAPSTPAASSTPATPPPEPTASPGVRQGALLAQKVAPSYPRSCWRRNHKGTVLLDIHVSATGQVLSVAVRSSAGCKELDDSALEAYRAARFHPARRGGQPIEQRVVAPVVFQLR